MPLRINFEVWVPRQLYSPNQCLQLGDMLLHTISHGDESVKENKVEVYAYVRSETGEQFDLHIMYAQDPASVQKRKGFNFNLSKAHNMIMIAKQLVLFTTSGVKVITLHIGNNIC